MKPFFSIITRTMPGRAELLERCAQLVKAQSFTSVEHLIIHDEVGVGVADAQRFMHTASPRGEYVLVLDDDDYLSAPDVLEKLHAEIAGKRPPFAVVKVAHGVFGEMPLVWGDGVKPNVGEITVSNVVVEHVQWYLHRKAFGAHYAGDWDWVNSLFAEHAPQWVDLNLVTVEMMRRGGCFAERNQQPPQPERVVLR